MPVYISIVLEVTFYSVISTYFVGLDCGTFFFLFSIVPIIIYFGSILFQGGRRWSIVLMLGLNFATYIVLYFRFFDQTPLFRVSALTTILLNVFSAFAMVFAVIFYNVMYIFTSENMVTNLEQKNRQLSADAREDALTSLLNRRGFLPLIRSLMERKSAKKFCIAFWALDISIVSIFSICS